MVSENVKTVGYVVGGGLAAYVVDNVAQMINPHVPTLKGLAQPSNIAKIVGGIVVPIIAAYHKKGSMKTRMFEAGVAAYYLPQVIALARSLVGVPATFSRVNPTPYPAYMKPAFTPMATQNIF